MHVHVVFGGGYLALGTEYWKSRPVRESASGSCVAAFGPDWFQAVLSG